MLNDDPNPEDDSGHGTHKAGVVGAALQQRHRRGGHLLGGQDTAGKGAQLQRRRPGLRHRPGHHLRRRRGRQGDQHELRQLHLLPIAGRCRPLRLRRRAPCWWPPRATPPRWITPSSIPAAYPQVLAVAATDEDDKVADFSQHHSYVGISAPGVHIVSTFWRDAGYGSYVSSSGTSDAAPHVSGLAALIWSVNPGLTTSPGEEDHPGHGRRPGRARQRRILRKRAASTPTRPSWPLGPASRRPPRHRFPPPPRRSATPGPAPAPATLPRTVWYFAEGSTAAPFDLWLLIQNPNAAAATAKVSYMKGDGSVQMQEVWLPPVSRKSIYVNQLIPDAELSMKVESRRPGVRGAGHVLRQGRPRRRGGHLALHAAGTWPRAAPGRASTAGSCCRTPWSSLPTPP